MTKFIQLHLLTSYPPSNLNRDDLGRPKTAIMGGAERLRISSQSLKRAWRTSDVFEQHVKDHIGQRSRRFGRWVYNELIENKIDENEAKKIAIKINQKLEKDTNISTNQHSETSEDNSEVNTKKKGSKSNKEQSIENDHLLHLSPSEINSIKSAVAEYVSKKSEDVFNNICLTASVDAVDIALFGRMLASNPKANVEAAAQVAHAITVHKVNVENDYFTAVDDLNKGEVDSGAAHLGETEFGSGLFYIYICIDEDLLLKNLNNDKNLAVSTIEGLILAAATVAPTGKQNSFASRAYASYICVEKGEIQPRSLSVAFLKPINEKDILIESINQLEKTIKGFNIVYGIEAQPATANVLKQEGSINEILAKACEGLK